MRVYERFNSVLPVLAQEELDELKASIMEDGIREPVLVWRNGDDDLIVDGMNRFRISQELGIFCPTRYKEFESEEDVETWIIRNQLARRNIGPSAASYLRGMLAKSLTSTMTAREAVRQTAEDTGASERTVWRDISKADAVESLCEPARTAVRTGKVKASARDIHALAEQDEARQVEAVQKVTNGESRSLGEVLRSADNVAAGECPKGGDHHWTSDGDGGQYCEKCLEPGKDDGHWENLAILHREAKRDLDRIAREFEERAKSLCGTYLTSQITRLTRLLKEASVLVRQHEPIGQSDIGGVITRIQQESSR